VNYLLVVLIIIVALGITGWLGLQVRPKAFAQPPLAQGAAATVPLPNGLPAPVERFYRSVYGDRVPVIDTVVITGRGRMRPFGIWLPARFVIVHQTGRNYRHYFEVTFFGLPFMRIDEGFLDGRSFFESLMGRYQDDANTNQAANLALWAEAGWFPALWVTDPGVRWVAVDEDTALLRVPYGETVETFVVRFDPPTGRISMMETMRYRRPGDEVKILWITDTSADGRVAYATWLDEGRPWAELVLEKMIVQADVSEYIRRRGYRAGPVG